MMLLLVMIVYLQIMLLLLGTLLSIAMQFIGGLTPIHQFTRIGSYSMIGGASGVNQDICPFVLAEGNKAVIRGLNSIGLRRRGFTDDEISNLKKHIEYYLDKVYN